MSPSSRETVVNRALSGTELKKIVLSDMQRLVDNEGLLSDHIAFGRVSYRISLTTFVDDPTTPKSTIDIESRPIAHNLRRRRDDALEVIEKFPLAEPSTTAEIGQLDLTRVIDSPNAERLREGMPIPVLTRGHDGTTQMENITYPPGSFPETGAGEMMIEDATKMARQRWGLVEPTAQPTDEPEPEPEEEFSEESEEPE